MPCRLKPAPGATISETVPVHSAPGRPWSTARPSPGLAAGLARPSMRDRDHHRSRNPYQPAQRAGSALAEDGAWLPERRCPLCQQPAGPVLRRDSRCLRCHSPLAALPGPGQQGQDGLGRRGAVRRDQGHVATAHVGWPPVVQPVRWRDLSLTGLSLYLARPLPLGTRLRVVDPALEAVAEVVGCRAQGRVHVVHAQLLTALLLQSTGVFMSTLA